jgi:hypothetical protein
LAEMIQARGLADAAVVGNVPDQTEIPCGHEIAFSLT